jgi:hypothetical protein
MIAAAIGGPHLRRLATELVAARLWEPVPGGWRFHHYEAHQTPRRERDRKRSQASERQRRHRDVTRDELTQGARHDDLGHASLQKETEKETPESVGLALARPTQAPGGALEAPDFVGAYVEMCQRLGTDPTRQQRARVGKEAKALAPEKPPELILQSIRRLAERNRQPNALPYLIAEIERERSGVPASIAENPIDRRVRLASAAPTGRSSNVV